MVGKLGAILAAGLFCGLIISGTDTAQSGPLEDTKIGLAVKSVTFGKTNEKDKALAELVTRGNKDVAAALTLSLRFRQNDANILSALNTLTGQSFKRWHDAMLWQEKHPEIKPHDSFRHLKLEVYKHLDPAFERFIGAARSKPEDMKIRLEEVTWGGVPVDGIPSLDNPKLISADAATYMVDGDLVFGVEINGDIRAYPLRIMGWHEMFNETIGGVPVALAYCTLCGAGILFETKVEGRERPFIFGSSGFLYRSNKLMFDRETDSLWNQFTGEPVSGPLVHKNIKLKIRPVTITTWAKWKSANPTTKVLAVNTGHKRDYGSGVVYNAYFSSPNLMFPVNVRDESKIKRKDYVFGIRDFGAAKAWPITAFANMPVINDMVGSRNIVLVGDASSRTVRAYERGDMTFMASKAANSIEAMGNTWKVREDYLLGPDGKKLPRVAGHISYWFAWDGYLGVESELYSVKNRS